MNEIEIKFEDNSEEVIEEFEKAILKSLEICGMTAEGYAKKLCPVDTGLLRNSITHAIGGESAELVSYRADKTMPGRKNGGSYSGVAPNDKAGEHSVYIGTNVEYASHVCLGTGKHTEGGRPTNWIYKDDKGTHMTGGNKAQPFLKPAVADHKETYRNIIKSTLKGEL